MFKFFQFVLVAILVHRQFMEEVPCDDNLDNLSWIIFEDEILCNNNQSMKLSASHFYHDVKVLTNNGVKNYRIASRISLNDSCSLECDGCYDGNVHNCLQCSHISRGFGFTYPKMSDIITKKPLDCSCAEGMIEQYPQEKQCVCNIQDGWYSISEKLSYDYLDCFQCPLNMAICEGQNQQGNISIKAIKCIQGIGRSSNTIDNCNCKQGYQEYSPIQQNCQKKALSTSTQIRQLAFNGSRECSEPLGQYDVVRLVGSKWLCVKQDDSYRNELYYIVVYVQQDGTATGLFIVYPQQNTCAIGCSAYHCYGPLVTDCFQCISRSRGQYLPTLTEVIDGLQNQKKVDCSCRPNYIDQNSSSCYCPSPFIERRDGYELVMWNCTLPCNKPCSKCIKDSNTLCAECQDAKMIYNPKDYTCICPVKYYMSLVDSYCYGICIFKKACHQSCQTCSYSTESNCLSCLENSYRIFLNGKCICPDHYVISTQPICQQCDWSCDTCLTIDTCQTCMAGDNRYVGPSGLCICSPGFADDLGTSTCRKCIYSCLTCDGFYDSCSSCQLDSYRYLEDQQCKCQKYYYDIGDTICQQCHFTCMHCDGPLSTNCIQCENSINRELNQKKECVCKEGFGFQDEFTLECLLCNIQCQTCGQIDQCLTCQQGTYRLLTQNSLCLCDEGYYEEQNQQQCKQCHYTCQTCQAQGFDNCVSCNYDLGREIVNNQCRCLSGYYEIFKICAPCYYTCLSCINQYSNGCTSCPQSRQLLNDLNPSQCICKSQAQIDDGKSLECSYCHYTCQTCYGDQSNNCLSCYDHQESGTRLIKYGTCSCPSFWFDDGVTEQCQQCHPSCQSCFDATIYGCITCSELDHRHQLSTSCLCMDGYFEEINIPQKSCSKCDYRCATCVNDKANCLSCPQDSKRQLTQLKNNSVFKTCSCPPDIPNDVQDEPICQKCHFSCANCLNPDISACTVCSDQYNRQLTINQSGSFCSCKESFYEVGHQECETCADKCQNCINIATNCISCYPDQHRVLSGNICICSTRVGTQQLSYYDNFIDNDCVACHYSCQTCNGSQYNNCLNCSDLDYRYQQGSECLCLAKYIDNGERECLGCDYSCDTCDGNKYICTSCPIGSLRTLNAQSQQCECPQGYYDAGISECQKCDQNCNSCSNQSTTCLSCVFGSNRIYNSFSYSCDCQDGFYDAGDGTCKTCHFSCLRCSGPSSSDCTQCTDFISTNRILNINTCICADKYYDDSANQICQNCSSTCYTCQNSKNYCTQCYPTQNRGLVGSSCICIQKYYDAGKDVCELCSIYCLTCQNGPEICTACDSSLNRYLKQQKCECQDAYYDNLQLSCLPCHYSCQRCKNQLSCTSCDLNSLRELVNGQCICQFSTLEMGVKQCAICDQSCQTCQGQPNLCTSCNQSLFRILNGSQCQCQDGYFENSLKLCQLCNQQCLTCINNEFNCLSCPANKTLNQNTCVCQNGYYTDSDNNCQLCSDQCLLCKNTATHCTSCKQNRILKNNTCQCLDGYYLTTSSECSPCSFQCQTCSVQADNCLTCSDISNRIKQGNQCICQSGFYDIGSNICQACNLKCLTCQTSATSCQSCDSSLLRILQGDQCVCQPGYYDSGLPLCQKCDVQCKTCIQSSYKCTSCELNTFRMDQSLNFNKCPCEKGFYDDSTQVCKKCSYKCINCVDQFDNCTICNANPGYFRENILPLCNCQDGYFDDGIQVICQKCDFKCLTCSQSPTNCLQCESPQTRNPSPVCDCRSGYYQDSQTQMCKQCSIQCETCIKAADNCVTCKPDRYTKNCICQDGYFEANQLQCQQCSSKCQTCQDDQLNCMVCQLNRINPPNCVCEDHYYDDYVNTQCQECNQYCGKCDFQGCIDCAANRVKSGLTCICPNNSISYDDIAWCSNCDVAVVQARFSDDLKYINVKFEYPLLFHFPIQVDVQAQCQKILIEQSLNLIGESPKCSIDDDTIIIELGNGATVVVGDVIEFHSEYLKHLDCQNSLQVITRTIVNQPINLLKPIIKLNYPQFAISPCQQLQITIDQQLITGGRNLMIIWKSSIPLIEVDQANQLQFQTLTIESGELPENYQINFSIEFKNFLNQADQQQIKINTLSSTTPQFNFQQSKSQFLVWIPIRLMVSYSNKGCNQSDSISNKISEIKITFEEIESLRNPQSSIPLIFQQIQFILNDEEDVLNVLIPARQLSISTNYSIKASYIDERNQNYLSIQQDIQILKSPLMVQIKDGTRVVNYLKAFTIEVLVKDPDLATEWNTDPEIQIEVSCLDLQNNNQSCRDVDEKEIFLNKTKPIQYIGQRLFKPFTVLSFKATCKKQNLISFDSVQIILLDTDLPSLNVNYPAGYSIRDININEQMQFEIQLNNNQHINNIQFRYCLVYNYETVHTQYTPNQKIKFSIWDHFTNFSYVNKIQIRILAHDVKYLMPQQFSLLVSINLPPTNSKITIQPKVGNALFTKFSIMVQNAKDNDSPLQYRFAYYKSEQLLQDDVNNSKQDNLIIAQDFSKSQKFVGLLESGNLTCLIQVSDSLGSTINFTQQINVKSFHTQMQLLNVTCESFIQQFLDTTFDIGQQIIISKELVKLLNQNMSKSCIKQIHLILDKFQEPLFSYLISTKNVNQKTIISNLLSVLLDLQQNNLTRFLQKTQQSLCIDNGFIHIHNYQNPSSSQESTLISNKLKQLQTQIDNAIQQNTELIGFLKQSLDLGDEQTSRRLQQIIYLRNGFINILSSLYSEAQDSRILIRNNINKLGQSFQENLDVDQLGIFIDSPSIGVQIQKMGQIKFQNYITNTRNDEDYSDLNIFEINRFIQISKFQSNVFTYTENFKSQFQNGFQKIHEINNSEIYYLKSLIPLDYQIYDPFIYVEAHNQLNQMNKIYQGKLAFNMGYIDQCQQQYPINDQLSFVCANLEDKQWQFDQCQIDYQVSKQGNTKIVCYCNKINPVTLMLLNITNQTKIIQVKQVYYSIVEQYIDVGLKYNTFNLSIILLTMLLIPLLYCYTYFKPSISINNIQIEVQRISTDDIEWLTRVTQFTPKLFKENIKYLHEILRLFTTNCCYLSQPARLLLLIFNIGVSITIFHIIITFIRHYIIAIGVSIIVTLILQVITKMMEGLFTGPKKLAYIGYFILISLNLGLLLINTILNTSNSNIQSDILAIVILEIILYGPLELLLQYVRLKYGFSIYYILKSEPLNPMNNFTYYFFQDEVLICIIKGGIIK